MRAMNWRCRWFGHKRRPLDGDGNSVSIRNVDGCERCGVLIRAERDRSGTAVVYWIDDPPRFEKTRDWRFKL
jgi:hypothetical protein